MLLHASLAAEARRVCLTLGQSTPRRAGMDDDSPPMIDHDVDDVIPDDDQLYLQLDDELGEEAAAQAAADAR